MTEIWKDVVGYDGRYQVSNMGRVRSTDAYITTKAGWQTLRKGRLLKNVVGNHGYNIVTLWRENRHRTQLVHLLVLNHFVGSRPEGMEACHNNGMKTDARLSNLRWDTPSANNMDKLLHGTMVHGEKVIQAKLSEASVAAIRSEYASGDKTQRDLAAAYGVTQSTISRVVRGTCWKY